MHIEFSRSSFREKDHAQYVWTTTYGRPRTDSAKGSRYGDAADDAVLRHDSRANLLPHHGSRRRPVRPRRHRPQVYAGLRDSHSRRPRPHAAAVDLCLLPHHRQRRGTNLAEREGAGNRSEVYARLLRTPAPFARPLHLGMGCGSGRDPHAARVSLPRVINCRSCHRIPSPPPLARRCSFFCYHFNYGEKESYFLCL